MLTAPKMKIIEDLVANATREELIWLNGYLNGFVSASPATQNRPVETVPPGNKKATILFATETGNSKKLATSLSLQLKKTGCISKLVSLDLYKPEELLKEGQVFFIISTHGEGEPPATATKFFEHLQKNNLSYEHLQYAILALGDTAYPFFCKAGEDLSVLLLKAGAKELLPVEKCDVDFEEAAKGWFSKIQQVISDHQPSPVSSVIQNAEMAAGKRYYTGRITTNVNLNDRGSTKETFHIEIAVDEAVQYEPGDALATVPQNRVEVVDEIIKLSGADKNHVLETSKKTATIQELLTHHLNICYLPTTVVKKIAAITGHSVPEVRIDLKDLLRIYPLKNSSQFEPILQTLTPIAPRLYSIASSPAVHGNEIHLTVSKNSYLLQDEQRFGLCSEFLGGLDRNSNVRFYIHRNRAFKIARAEQDIIMVGPGNGIAPFRSFLAHRDATGSTGRSWLLFEEENFQTDFLYQAEMQQYLASGVLSKVSLAFLKNTQRPATIMDRLEEQQAELTDWLRSGANFYLAGEKPAVVSIEQKLKSIIGEQLFSVLKKEGRYQKDVY